MLLAKPRLPLRSTDLSDKLFELSTVDTFVEFEVSFDDVFVVDEDVTNESFDVVVAVVVDDISPVELSLVDVVVTLRSAISCLFILSNCSM